MNQEIVFRKISVKERLPKTESQHSEDFLSDEVAVLTDEGLSSAKYRRTYNLMNVAGNLRSEGWCSVENITHWLEPTPLASLIEEGMPTEEEIMYFVGDEIQQDWNDLRYRDIYEEGLLKAFSWLKSRLSTNSNTEKG